MTKQSIDTALVYSSFNLWTRVRCLWGNECWSCLTSYEHGADGEDLLRVCVGRHVSKAHAGEAAQSKVERCHVAAPHRRPPETTGHGVGPRHVLAPRALAGVPGALPPDLWPGRIPLADVGREAADGGGDQRCQGRQDVRGTQTFGQLMEPTLEKERENLKTPCFNERSNRWEKRTEEFVF